MCGIGGFYSTTGGSAPVESIEALWKALEGRGTHAAGFALNWRDSDEPIVRKKACRASKMTGELRRLCGSGDNTHYVMLHTRYTTQGSTDNNANNHPVVRDGIVLTHNGVLHNDDEVFAILDLERTAQVDTEAINASLRHLGTQWTVENVEGSMSIAWVDTQESTKTVHLMTNGNNPLVIARLTSGDIVWASTEDILWEAPKKAQQVWFIQQFGANVNLGNIGPWDIIPLEALRLGLRGDTFFDHLPESMAEGLRQEQNSDDE